MAIQAILCIGPRAMFSAKNILGLVQQLIGFGLGVFLSIR